MKILTAMLIALSTISYTYAASEWTGHSYVTKIQEYGSGLYITMDDEVGDKKYSFLDYSDFSNDYVIKSFMTSLYMSLNKQVRVTIKRDVNYSRTYDSKTFYDLRSIATVQ